MGGNGWRDEDEDRIQGAKYLKHEIFGAKCHTGDEIRAKGHPSESGPVPAGPCSCVANGDSELGLKGWCILSRAEDISGGRGKKICKGIERTTKCSSRLQWHIVIVEETGQKSPLRKLWPQATPPA